MHIAYSALRTNIKNPNARRFNARQHGYQAACEKHRETLAQIRQYMPGWEPPFLAGDGR